MSLPAEVGHRWAPDGGGEGGYLDAGDAVISSQAVPTTSGTGSSRP
jgi:hypothetical protein